MSRHLIKTFQEHL